jgi:2,4-dienoyl-CoA reductase-like NADH-dependent reductase (Old Yellow Enzyme family)/thioredoxin reductase
MTMDARLQHLFEPIKLGPVVLPNRICASAHSTHFAKDGLISDTQIDYYSERARGGAGWIVVGASVVHESQLWEQGFNLVTDPRAREGYRRLTDAVHRHGAKISTQMDVFGIGVPPSRPHPWPTYSPSDRIAAIDGEIPKKVDEDDMKMFIDLTVDGCNIAMDCGFDGVEISAAFDCSLIQNFLTPRFNNRTDEYGGTLENRMRFPLRLLRAAREAVGDRGFFGLKIVGDEMIEGGLSQEDVQEICRLIDAENLVDYFHICFGVRANFELILPDMTYPAGFAAYLAAGVREIVKVPVVAVKRIDDPLLAARIIADGQADIVAMARALIADPDLPNKAKAGDLNLIRQCTSSNQECGRRAEETVKLPLRCIQNPAVGMEGTLSPALRQRAVRPKSVIVVGGGPGGLRAAKVAAERGHTVQLFEARDRLGGEVLSMLKVPSRAGYESITRYLVNEVDRHGVKVHLNQHMDAASVKALNPDVVILATGSKPVKTGFSSDLPHVAAMPGVAQDHVLSVPEIFADPGRVGQEVLLVDELGSYEAQLSAEYLCTLGRTVTFVTRHAVAGAKLDGTSRTEYKNRMRESGLVTFVVNTGVESIDGHTVRGTDYLNGGQFEHYADTVVLVMDKAPNADLYFELHGDLPEVFRVGDAVAPRHITEAIFEGNQVALAI